MNKSHWAAIYSYCEKNCCTKYEILSTLKQNGTVDRNTRLEELGDLAGGSTYDDMMKFLEENL